jgi:NAD(P)-dependent dehydrogenase (short-subunit alcohol dehydrogenase family)
MSTEPNRPSILITGANRGIGLGLTAVFARHGWQVYAAARQEEPPALGSLRNEFPSIEILNLDVTRELSLAGAAEILAEEPLDILVNNAAIFPGEGTEGILELDPEWFDQAFATNVTGVVRTVRAFLPALRRSARPRIVNISSGAGSISAKNDFRYYPYSVSKAALNMLTRCLAAELAPDPIPVVAISPGWVRTDMGGPEAPLSVEESAASLFHTITSLEEEQSGCFLGRDGRSGDYAW